MYVTNAADNTVSVIRIATNTVGATIPGVGQEPFGVAVTPNGKAIYVTHYPAKSGAVGGSPTISVINASSNTVIATLNMPAIPTGLAITPDGAFVYSTVGLAHTIVVIDTKTNTITKNITLGTAPGAIAITPGGKSAYAAGSNGNVFVIDTCSNRIVTSIPIPNGNNIGTDVSSIGINGMTISPDGKVAYVTDLRMGTVVLIDTSSNQVTSTIQVGSEPAGSAITPDGSLLYVPNNNGSSVSVISTSSRQVVATIPTGQGPNGIAMSPDGKSVYVTLAKIARVVVINTATNTVVTNIPVGRGPAAIADGIVSSVG